MLKTENRQLTAVQRISSLGEVGLLLVFAVLFIFFSVTSPYFFTVRNLSNILGQISLTLIAAIGLAILVVLFRSRQTINVQDLDTLKG